MSKCRLQVRDNERGATARTAGDASDAPSNRNRHIADPVLARQRALQLRRQRRRQKLHLEHDFLARARRLAVGAEGRAQESLVDEEVEGNGRGCLRGQF